MCVKEADAVHKKAKISVKPKDDAWTVWWNQDKLCYKHSFDTEYDANNFITTKGYARFMMHDDKVSHEWGS